MSDLLNQASLVMVPSGYKEDTVYSVVPTNGNGDLSFTRASNGTRVNSAGLVEVCPWNFNTESENFTLNWGTDGTSTATNNFATAPNGTTTAAKVVVNSVNGYGYKNVNVAPNTYTVSYYIKASTNSTGGIGINDIGGAGYSSTSINITTEWQRFEHTFNVTLGTALYIDYGFASTSVNYFIWGAQLNIGSTAKPYFPTTDRLNVPRLTYQNGGGGCPSLLLEKQSTNLVTYSEQIDNAVWTKGNATVNANVSASPDGTSNADKVIPSTSVAFHNVTNSLILTIGTVYTISAFAKADGYNYVAIGNGFGTRQALFNLSNGDITTVTSSTTAEIKNYGNGWYRCSITFETTNTLNQPQITVDNGSNAQYAGNGTSGAFIWGSSVEIGSYPTSYIPTTSSSATRVKDLAYKSGATALIGQTEGVLFCDFNLPSVETSGDYPFIVNMWKDSSNRFGFARYPNGGVHIYMQYGGSAQFTYNTAQLTGRFKLALGYKANDCVIYLNGTLLQTITSATIPATDDIIFNGINTSGDYNTQLQINQTALFKTRLTNAELASLTTI